MKVGIGVTSGRLDWCGTENCATPPVFNLDQTTIANDKNRLIKILYDAGCDYMFIFDDDCFPIKPGWEKFFIDASLKTGVQHFNLCRPEHQTRIGANEDITLWSTGTGCMLFLTRKCIDIVGYMNPAYGKYGYEHCAYSLRIQKAGLTPAWYVSANGWEEFIYSWDLQGDMPGFTKIPARTEEERTALIAANEAEWQKERDGIKIYYEYE